MAGSGDQAAGLPVLDPDELAEAAWDLYTKRDRAEAAFDVIGGR